MAWVFIDFHVPALTLHLNITETSLQLSENITHFAVCRIYTADHSPPTSAEIKNGGAIHPLPMFGAYHLCIYCTLWGMTEPCGSPACISLGIDILPLTEASNFLWQRKELLSLSRLRILIMIIYIATQGARFYQWVFQYRRIQLPLTCCWNLRLRGS
jgi:hypothetical protein